MRYLKTLTACCMLLTLSLPVAQAADIPGETIWYFHVDLAQMKAEPAGMKLYAWLRDEALNDVRDEAGIDIEQELDRMTAFAVRGQGPVVLFEGDISQDTRDKLMAMVAAGGNIDSQSHAGQSYFRLGEGVSNQQAFADDDFEAGLESLEEEAWVSMSLRNKVLITGSEAQMQSLLKNKGRIPGGGSKGPLMVLTAEKTLLQAGMDSSAFNGQGEDGWDSNILRNTEQLAFMVAAVAGKLAIEAQLVTAEPEMAQSLASVVRGLVSLMAFNDDLGAEAIAMIQGTKVEAEGNSLSISLAIDPDLVIATLSE